MKKPAKIAIVVIVVLVIIGALGSGGNSSNSNTAANTNTSAATATNQAAAQSKQDTQSQASTSGISPEVKKFLEDYETYMNEYCDFMENYDSTDLSQLSKYTSMMSKAAELAKDSENMKGTLNDEELMYYLEVTSRVTARVAEATAKMQSKM